MPSEPIDVEQARRLILSEVEPLPSEAVELRAALGRVLAEDVRSADAVPAFESSAMDGFAVRARDTARGGDGAPAQLRLVGEARAGQPAHLALGSGEAIAISTGAVVPDGADAVVRLEDATARDGIVEVGAAVEPGRFVRRRGEDIVAGATVLGAGASLGAPELGVIASVGRVSVSCRRRPRVAVLTSGDELVEPGGELRPGQVRDSSGYAVPALVELAGAQVAARESVGDDVQATAEAVGRALEADVAIVCGGVSVGDHDHVRGAFADQGADEVFWGVALRPGKPTWFGVRGGGEGEPPRSTLAFGLPGNPVSAIVTFVLFVWPALRALAGAPAGPARATAILDSRYEKHPGRAHAVRCLLTSDDDGLHATPTGPRGSHVLTSMLGANALAMIPAASGPVEAGERVEIELLPAGVGGLGAGVGSAR